jgi:hypothetical protein
LCFDGFLQRSILSFSALLMTGRSKKKAKKFARGPSKYHLLTCGGVQGLPSDDSDDSDYEPEGELIPSTSQNKRKRGTIIVHGIIYRS